MNRGRLLSIVLFVVTLAVGVGIGRVLGAEDETAPTTTLAEATPATTIPSLVADILEPTGPTLSELVPSLTHPVYLETANPTQLLRWDLNDVAPRPVADIPPGSDLRMDRDARYVVVSISHENTSILLGGLVGTPLTILAEDVHDSPHRDDFSDVFWFAQGDDYVAMNTRGVEVNRIPIPQLIAEDEPGVTSLGGPTMTLADEEGLVIQQWYTSADEEPIARRSLLRAGGYVTLPEVPTSYVSALLGDHVLIRQRSGAITSIDRGTGVVEERPYDGACGYTSEAPDGTLASVCNGAVILAHSPAEPLLDVGTWTAGRWSGSGAWYIAVGGYFGELLFVNAETGEMTKVPFPLTKNALVVDAWSGA